MHVLVSFCHVRTPGRPILGLLDPCNLKFSALAVPGRSAHWRGLTGLAIDERYLYAAAIRVEELLIFDRVDLSLVGSYTLRSVVDVHSLWVKGTTLYAVSSGTDEVVALGLRGADVVSEEVFWRPAPNAPAWDQHHLNAVTGRQDALFVAGFGTKGSDHWSSAKNGFITNISTGNVVATGLYHPHSLTSWDGGIAYCESAKCLVRELGTDRSVRLPGYTRGLCTSGEKLFAATSAGREILDHIDAVALAPPAELATVGAGRCTISRLSLDSFEIEATLDLGDYGREIYDLLPLEGADRWPILDEVAWREEALRGLETRLLRRGRAAVQPTNSVAPDIGQMVKSPKPTKAFIDQVNGVVIPRPQRSPEAVIGTGPITVEGWAVDDEADAAAAGVFVVVDGARRFWATYGTDRADVARGYDKPSYRRSGYVAEIPAEILAPGRHTLTLEVVAQDRRSYFAPAERAEIDITAAGDQPAAVSSFRDQNRSSRHPRLPTQVFTDRWRGTEGDMPGSIPMPPEKLVAVIGGGTPERVEQISEAFLNYFIGLGELQRDDRVLDVGCGVGRMAAPLTAYLSEKGSYEGFDIRKDLIGWCRENISRRYSNFNFAAVDVYNGQTNPHGTIRDSDFTFPYNSGIFDFVIVTSVFTHMLPEGVKRYTQEISRVLKTGGRCFATFFLINDESLQLVAEGRSRAASDGTGRTHPLSFSEERGACRFEVSELPEAVVAYDERFVFASYEANGLQLKPPIWYGSWCGRSIEFSLSFQDIILARKR